MFKKIFSLILVIEFILLFQFVLPSPSHAGNVHCVNNNCEYTGDYGNGWSYKCWNKSCEAHSGKLALYWTGKPEGGKITGVDGLPIKLEMFRDSESRVSQMFGDEDLSEQSGRGRRISIDHSLNFLFWLPEFNSRIGNLTRRRKGEEGEQEVVPVSDIDIFVYMYEMDNILSMYKTGEIIPHIETYFFSQRVSDMEKFSILDDKVSPFLKMVKILVNFKCKGANDIPLSYTQQYLSLVFDIENKERAGNLNKVITRTREVLSRFKMLCRNNYQNCIEQTDEVDLYIKGDKELSTLIYFMKNNFSLSESLLKLGTSYAIYKEWCGVSNLTPVADLNSDLEAKAQARLAEAKAKAEEEVRLKVEAKEKAEEETKAKVKGKVKKVQKSSKIGGVK